MKVMAHRIRITTPNSERWYADKIGQEFWAEYVGSDFPWKIIQEGEPTNPRYVHAFECVVVREAEVEVDLIQVVREDGMPPILDAITEELTTLAEYRDICEDIHQQLTERGEVDPYTRDRLKILMEDE